MSKRLIDLHSGPGYLDAGLKIGWAKHHLRALDEEMRKFLNGEAYRFSTYDDLDAGEHIVRLDIGDHDIALELIVGDFVSCLRGSLDHLVYHLTLAPGGTPNDRGSFPILDVMNSEGRKMFNRVLSGVPPAAITVIDALQPYHSGDAYEATKLWRLHRLWNIDKHRRIPFHGTVAKMGIGVPDHVPSPIIRGTKDGSEARFPIAAKGQLQFDPAVEVTVEFGDASEGIAVPYGELIEIHNFVRDDVMPRFKSFF